MSSPAQKIDDKTAAYIVEVHRYFENLRQVASQIAGFLVLAASGGQSATPDHPLLKHAACLHQEATDALRLIRTTEQARQHHHYLLQASVALGDALAAARRHLDSSEIDPILVPLRAGYAELERASKSLPGFEMIGFDQSCCALASPRSNSHERQ
jgi:hypothetical protein